MRLHSIRHFKNHHCWSQNASFWKRIFHRINWHRKRLWHCHSQCLDSKRVCDQAVLHAVQRQLNVGLSWTCFVSQLSFVLQVWQWLSLFAKDYIKPWFILPTVVLNEKQSVADFCVTSSNMLGPGGWHGENPADQLPPVVMAVKLAVVQVIIYSSAGKLLHFHNQRPQNSRQQNTMPRGCTFTNCVNPFI